MHIHYMSLGLCCLGFIMIDFIILEQMTAFAVFMQKHPGCCILSCDFCKYMFFMAIFMP